MFRSLARITSLVGAVSLSAACASDGALAPITVDHTPSAQVVTGGPDLADFRNFAGDVYACVDAPSGMNRFAFIWKITNRQTNAVVASGVTKNVASTTCVKLFSLPSDTRAHFVATVKEDPGGQGINIPLKSITADYGHNTPIQPTNSFNIAARRATSNFSSDVGVQFTFVH